jgi:hypothetical protein
MTDSKLRKRFGFIMDWRVQWFFSLLNLAGATTIQYLRWRSERHLPFCRSALAPWPQWTLAILVGLALWCWIVKKLRGRDTLAMSTEIMRTVGAFLLCYAPMIAVIGLMESGIVPPDSRIQLLTVPCSLYTIFDINVLSRPAWGNLHPVALKRPTYFSSSTRSIRSASVHSTTGSEYMMDTGIDPASLNTSLAVIQVAPLCLAYAAFVEKSLCYESFKFLVDATSYAKDEYDSVAAQVRDSVKLYFMA